jgi:membrane associated rhomboid family serine protease
MAKIVMHEPVAICTCLIIVLTVFCSFIGFRDPAFAEKLIFAPTEILACKQYYRLITSAFLHADLRHLLNNMVSLFFFGRVMEIFVGPGQFLLIYFASVAGGSLLSLWLHRNHDYRAYGASGGVCGVVFSYIALDPNSTLLAQWFIPMPAWAYGILFLIGSYVALKRGTDNIGHDAHIGGAVIGLWATGALQPWAVRENLNWFLILSALSIALFIYFLKNPMLLPLSSFAIKWNRPKASRKTRQSRSETLELDVVLDKISRDGFDSLTREEKALLGRVSAKYQSHAQSEKPKSDLII